MSICTVAERLVRLLLVARQVNSVSRSERPNFANEICRLAVSVDDENVLLLTTWSFLNHCTSGPGFAGNDKKKNKEKKNFKYVYFKKNSIVINYTNFFPYFYVSSIHKLILH